MFRHPFIIHNKSAIGGKQARRNKDFIENASGQETADLFFMYVSDLIAGVKDLDHIQIFEDLVHKKELKTFIGHRPVEKLKRAVAGAHGLRAYKLALHNEG